MHLDRNIPDPRESEAVSPIPPRDDLHGLVRLGVGEGGDLPLEVGEPGPVATPHASEAVSERAVEPGASFLCHLRVDASDSARVECTPPREVPARVHVRERALLLPPRLLSPFECVVPPEPKLLELLKEFPLLRVERIQTELVGNERACVGRIHHAPRQ